MARPTISSKNTFSHRSIIDSAIRGPEIATDSVGLTQAATVIKRKLTVVSCGLTPSTAYTHMLFRAPASGATITGLKVNFGSTQNHAVNEADVWIWDIKNLSTAGDMSKQACSLSNQTLAATSWRDTPVNGGNSTLNAGAGLRIDLSISGTPAALQWPAVAIEWEPTNNA